jgi:predicted transposase YbfD/YdcC
MGPFPGKEALMAARKLRSLMAHFERLDDPRVERTRKHDLLDLIAVALCAVICGADSWPDVERYGRAKEPWLRRFLALPNGIPSHDTFGRVFARLDPEQFGACFAGWVAEVARRLGLGHVAIDGKALRGAHDRRHGQAALHLVSAWATEAHLALGQEAVGGKSNEITAIPRLLALLDLEGALVTIDAMGCQTEIAQEVRIQGADYVLAVKENQPRLYEDIDRLAEAVLDDDTGVPSCLQEGRGHGRQEARACWVLHDLSGIRDRERWVDLRSIVIVVSERTVGGETAYERRYYISSRRAGARTFLEAIRGHWGIENSLHWVLDVCFDEDGSRLRKEHGPENLAVLRRLAVSVLKRANGGKGSIRGKRLTAGWDDGFLERALLDFSEN